jgi:hypothetical protein
VAKLEGWVARLEAWMAKVHKRNGWLSERDGWLSRYLLASSSLCSNSDIPQKLQMGDVSKELANTVQLAKKYPKSLHKSATSCSPVQRRPVLQCSLIKVVKNRFHPCANLPCNVDSRAVAKKFAGLQVEIKKPKFESLKFFMI